MHFFLLLKAKKDHFKKSNHYNKIQKIRDEFKKITLSNHYNNSKPIYNRGKSPKNNDKTNSSFTVMFKTHSLKIINNLLNKKNEKTIETCKNEHLKLTKSEINVMIEKHPDKYLFLHDMLGKGAFGEVYLIENILNKELYAMKIMSKQKLNQLNMFEYIWNEKEILIKISHPFIAKLHYAFQNDKFLFLLMQYLPGGSLTNLIRNSNLF